MDKENIQKLRVEHHHFWGLLWIAAWLFAIGFPTPDFWRGVSPSCCSRITSDCILVLGCSEGCACGPAFWRNQTR